jgi:rod shape-determining protein MreC
MREFRTTDRALPLVVTLVVLSIVIMTFDIRSEGEGVLATVRGATNTLLEPVERLGSVVVSPLADVIENLSEIRSLRDENEALRAKLAEEQARNAANADLAARVAVLERVNDVRSEDLADYTTTAANVVGQTDSFDLSFRLDKGEEAGILVGHPVVDDFGYLVGRVAQSWSGGSIVVPIIADVNAVTVRVGEQTGTLEAVIGSDIMVFQVFETAVPVAAGDAVVTSSLAEAYPPGLPVGEISEDTQPTGQALTAQVRPFSEPSRLRNVIVITWPTDQLREDQETPEIPVVPGGDSEEPVGDEGSTP